MLVQKLRNDCKVLRDDGMSHGDYVEQLTDLLFLKMAEERSRPPYSQPSPIPAAYAWPSLLARDCDALDSVAPPGVQSARHGQRPTDCRLQASSSAVSGAWSSERTDLGSPTTMRTTSCAGLCGLLILTLAGCQTPPRTVAVTQSTTDQTSASALWMQAEIPGKPLANVFLRGSQGSSNVSIEVQPTDIVKITALATDNDSGIQRLELFGLLTVQRVSGNGWFKLKDHVSTNFGGVTSVAVPGQVPVTARMSTTIDFNALSAGADWVVVNLSAVATSGAPPAAGNPAKTDILTLYWKRPGTPPGS